MAATAGPLLGSSWLMVLKDRYPLLPVIGRLRDGWASEEETEQDLLPYKHIRKELKLRAGTLRRGEQVIIPAALRTRVLSRLHATHMGMTRMKSLARRYFWWPGLGMEIEDLSRRCDICNEFANAEPPVEQQHWPLEEMPMARVHLDYAGPITGWQTHPVHLLVAVDAYSSYPFVTVTNTADSKVAFNFLRETFAMFGTAKLVVTDNGAAFLATHLEDYLAAAGVKHLTSPVYHPASNGLAEKMVQTVKNGLKKLKEQQPRLGIREACRRILFDYRAAEHTIEIYAGLSLSRPRNKPRLRLPQSDH